MVKRSATAAHTLLTAFVAPPAHGKRHPALLQIDSILHHGNRGVCVATAKSACGDVSVLKIIPKAKLLTDAELMTKVRDTTRAAGQPAPP